MENTSPKRSVHVGNNIQRFRLMQGLSQPGLAFQLEKKRGKAVSQQIISDIEDRESIGDEELLKQVAEVLEVSPEALKNLDLDAALNIIANNFNDHSTQQINYQNVVHNSPNYNPLDKLIELFEKEKAEFKAEIQSLKKEIESLKKK